MSCPQAETQGYKYKYTKVSQWNSYQYAKNYFHGVLGQTGIYKPSKRSHHKHSSQMMSLTDGDTSHSIADTVNTRLPFRHNGRNNILYLDGHVGDIAIAPSSYRDSYWTGGLY